MIEIQGISVCDAEQEVLQFHEPDMLATYENISQWRLDKRFSPWLQHGVSDKPDFVRCSLCCLLFKAISKDDLIRHTVFPRHQEAEAQFKKNATLTPAKTKLNVLLEDNDLKSWFTLDEHGNPFCSCCQAFLRGGKKDLLRHAKTEKHLKFLISPNSEYCW